MLCACKKYFSDQKNEILLVNLDNHQIDDTCDTQNFEVYCFCPITIKKGSTIDEKGRKVDSINNDFFFVGGFDNDKKEGKIKLYKVIFPKSEKKKEYKIEYLQDIELYKVNENKNKQKKYNKLIFEGPINSIIQIKNRPNEGEILATCYDGNVYRFSSPNLTFYTEN